MLKSLSEFPVRPQRMARESLAGYTHRLHWTNGHDVPVGLRAALRELFLGKRMPSRSDTAETMDLLVHSPDWLQSMVNAVGTHAVQEKSKWRRRRYNPFRYCPYCLCENGIHEVLWQLPLVNVCPRHSCELLSRCSACGRSISWGSIKSGWRCACGVRLSDAKSPPARQWSARIAAKVDQMVFSEPCDTKTPGETRLRRWSLLRGVYDELEWAYTLRRQLTRRNPYQPAKRPGGLHPAIRREEPRAWEVRLLSMEPEKVRRTLRRLERFEFRDKGDILVIRRFDGPLSIVSDALRRLPATRQMSKLHGQAADFFENLNLGVPGLSGVQFHPSISETDKERHLSALADWWFSFVQEIRVLSPNAELKVCVTSSFGVASTAHVIEVLNAFFRASARSDRTIRYEKLITRWAIPTHLRRMLAPEDILRVLGTFLLGLAGSELAFVRDLIQDSQEASCIPSSVF